MISGILESRLGANSAYLASTGVDSMGSIDKAHHEKSFIATASMVCGIIEDDQGQIYPLQKDIQRGKRHRFPVSTGLWFIEEIGSWIHASDMAYRLEGDIDVYRTILKSLRSRTIRTWQFKQAQGGGDINVT